MLDWQLSAETAGTGSEKNRVRHDVAGGSSSRFLTTYVVVIALSCIVRWRGSSMGASRSGVWHCPPSVVLPAPHASESHGAHRSGWLLHGIVGVLAVSMVR